MIFAIVLRNYSTKPSYIFQLKRELKVWKYIFKEALKRLHAILLIIGMAYGFCRIVIKSVQQCTYFLFSVNLLLIGVNYG
jgi:hypothetical protein